MISNVLMGTLNPTHSLNHSPSLRSSVIKLQQFANDTAYVLIAG